MIPFAVLTSVGGRPNGSAAMLSDRASALKADLLCVSNGGSVYSGSVTTASAAGGIATAISTPMYEQIMYGCCYRLSPVRLGLRWDETGMVTLVDEAARESKIIEGDKIVSIAGSSVSVGSGALRSPHLSKYLTLKPGEQVKLVWIRPGVGRMEGMATLLPNPPTHLALSDPVREQRAEIQKNRSKD